MRNERVRIIVEIGLTVALAAVLNTIQFWRMPLGGNVSLAMLPVFILAIRRGVGVGVLAGGLYGVVDYFAEPYFVHWVQILLDYPLAFAGLGAAGVGTRAWRRATASGRANLALWTVVLPSFMLGATLRYVSHFVSGVVFFATAELGGPLPEGAGAFQDLASLKLVAAYSAVYNLYIPVSLVLCFAAAAVLLPIIARVLDQTAATTSPTA